MRLRPAQLLALIAVGAAGGLIGDQGHVASETTRYIDHGGPFIWESPIWFALIVGAMTAATAELRLHLGPARPGDALEALGAISAVIGTYAVTALVHDQPLGPATALVWALAGLTIARYAGGWRELACGVAAAIAGTVGEIILVAAGVFEYGDGIDPLAGVPPWLPALYLAFGVVAARLGEILSPEWERAG